MFCHFVGALCIFSLEKISIVSCKQIEYFKITLDFKIALGVQKKLGLLEQKTGLSIAVEFLSLRPANFSSNRNVALHAHSLGSPCAN